MICYLGPRLQISTTKGEILRKADFSSIVFANEKNLIKELLKFQLRLNEKTSDDQVEELYHTIMDNRFVEFCGKYLGQIDRIRGDLDDVEKYRDKLATAERYAKDGKRLYARIYTEFLEKYERRLAENRANFSLLMTAHTLKVVNPVAPGELIDEDYEYTYSAVYCERVKKLLDETKALFSKHFDTYLNTMKCASDSISEFRKNHKLAARELSSVGFKDEAEKLLARVEAVITETEIRQKYESSLTEIDRDIAMLGTGGSLHYQKCMEMLEKLKGWRTFLDGASDLGAVLRKQYALKLTEAEQTVRQRSQDILDYADKLTASIQNGTTDGDLQKLLQELHKAEGLSLPENYQITIRDTLNDVNAFMQQERAARMDSTELGKWRADYETKWKATVCAQACQALIARMEAQMEKKRSEWVKANITEPSARTEQMTAEECIRWKSTHETYPDFLLEADIEALEDLREKMDQQLQSQRIQGVVSMYSKLTEAEKAECLRILQKM